MPTDHWSKRPANGFFHDLFWTRIFPQYDVGSREEGIARYCEEYYRVAGELAGKWPENVRIFEWRSVLESEAGQRGMLSFVGIPVEKQVIDVSGREMRGTSGPPPWPGDRGRGQNAAGGGSLHNGQNAAEGGTLHAEPRKRGTPNDAAGGGTLHDPRRCVILVPYNDRIVEPCEDSLRQLERRGYPVRRVVGYAAVDQARNQLATDALLHGFEETMWIDSDVAFRPEAVEALRRHDLPIVCGIYPQKGKRAIAAHVMPGTPKMTFGKNGGLHEIRYAGAGFLLIRREVYLTVQEQLRLPMCNERFGKPMIPFFQPMTIPIDDGYWYLAEDYAFCERARQCGYKIVADTSIRLWHWGSCGYGWEDAGVDRPRHGSFTLNFSGRREERQGKKRVGWLGFRIARAERKMANHEGQCVKAIGYAVALG